MSRPTKLTPDVTARLLQAVRLGATHTLACAAAGIGTRTLYGWVARARRGEEPFAQFWRNFKQAEAECAVRQLATIEKAAASGNWGAAAWKLERRFGYRKESEFHQPIQITVEAGSSSVAQLVEELRRHSDVLQAIDGPVIDLDEE